MFELFSAADHDLDINSLGYCEAAISSTLKAFFKLLPDPLISDDIAAKVLVINCESIDDQDNNYFTHTRSTLPYNYNKYCDLIGHSEVQGCSIPSKAKLNSGPPTDQSDS